MGGEALLATFIASLAKNGHVSLSAVMFGGIFVWGILYMTRRLIATINRLGNNIRFRLDAQEAGAMAAFRVLGKDVAEAAQAAKRAEMKAQKEEEEEDRQWRLNGKRRT